MKVYARYSDKEFQAELGPLDRYCVKYPDGSQKVYVKETFQRCYSTTPKIPVEQVVIKYSAKARYEVLDNGRYQLTFQSGYVETIAPDTFLSTCRLPELRE